MADFTKAIAISLINEGAYNPGIGEHETYKGIDRGANPNWSGWQIIDIIKRDNPDASVPKLNILFSQNSGLQANIINFYKLNYWNPFKGDQISDQQCASNLLDCSINQGSSLACIFMQAACNDVINTNGLSTPQIVVDGAIGPLTLNAFNHLPADKLFAQINSLRLASYQKDKEWAQWGGVWKRRLVNYV